ncbi:hypothetical protein [Micromonospora sp. NPDC004704]
MFLANDDLRVRCRIISLLNLRVDENSPELHPLIAEVIRIAHAHPDDAIVSRIRAGT